MIPERKSILIRLSDATSKLVETDVTLWGRNTIDSYQFNELKPLHTIVMKVCKYILSRKSEDFNIYTDTQIEDFLNLLEGLADEVQNIKDYHLDISDFSGTYDRIVRNYKAQYEDLLKSIKDFLLISLIQKDYLNNSYHLFEDIKKKSQFISDKEEEVLIRIDKIRAYEKEADEAIKRLEVALDNVSIVKYNGIFKDEAKKNKNASIVWLTAVGFMILTLVFFAVYIINNTSDGLNTHALIEIISTRIIIFSSLFVGLTVSIKNYNAQKHNQVLNIHRQNALNTFETFVKSAKGDSQIEQAILLEVTRTIFGNQNTGFTNSDNDVDSSSRVIEIIKNISNVRS